MGHVGHEGRREPPVADRSDAGVVGEGLEAPDEPRGNGDGRPAHVMVSTQDEPRKAIGRRGDGLSNPEPCRRQDTPGHRRSGVCVPDGAVCSREGASRPRRTRQGTGDGDRQVGL